MAVVVLLVPACLLALAALLWAADLLERRAPAVFVRLVLRTRAPDEVTERTVAAELAPLLTANGLDGRPAEAV